MTAQNFQPSLVLVLQSEGGNVDNPRDPGGRTSRGVTQHVYDAYRRTQKQSLQDVYHASNLEIADIYHQSYWEPWCDQLLVGLDYEFFDFAVNAGPHRAMLCLQRSVGVTQDGIYGPVTREAVAKESEQSLIVKFSDARRAFYESLHEGEFLQGWLNRTAFAENAALKMLGVGQ